MTDLFELLGIGLVAVSAYMLLVWMASRLINNYGLVDVAWAFGFFLVPCLYLWLGKPINGNLCTIAGMFMVWSLRLTWYLGLRFAHWYPKEDVRYANLRSTLGPFVEWKMLVIFLWQGAVLTLMTLPMVITVVEHNPEISLTKAGAIIVWFLALSGETIADVQLAKFARNSSNKNRTCQSGLWRYSRHPNYFFEWLGSVAFFLYVCDARYGIYAALCPAIMLHLLINVTGVKPSEQHSLATRPDYAEYQKTTSPFVPWCRKTS